MSHINENVLQLRTRANGGRPTLMKINPNRYNRVSFSARVGEGWVNADLTIDAWKDFCNYIRMATRLKEADSFAIQLKKKEQVYAVVVVGRDDDGLVYVELANTGGNKVRFDFLPKHQFIHMRSGKPMPESELSRNRAMAWADLVEPMVIELWKRDYKTDDAGPQGGGQRGNYNGGGNRGGYNNGGGNRGNYGGGNQPQAQPQAIDGDLDDYLP
ncbi:hypothetical protein pVa21_215 [Vibrio phage pVa-21]|nr:hypothetical protein pVa21_215 [Vibrio phage pVa-21]